MGRALSADGRVLVADLRLANSFLTRLKGLLGRRSLARDEGLLILPCNSVHSLGMKFSIGVLFLSADDKVLALIPEMRPGKLSPVVKGARKVLEMHPQTLQAHALGVGDQLRFEPAVD